jgi:hypothetical protein
LLRGARSLAAAINFDIKAFADTYPSEQPSGRSWNSFILPRLIQPAGTKTFQQPANSYGPC